jgi:hypothetical protein
MTTIWLHQLLTVGEDKVCEDPPKIDAPRSQNIEYICDSLHLCICTFCAEVLIDQHMGSTTWKLALPESNASLLLFKVYSLYFMINPRTMKISSLSQRTLHVQSPLQINVETHHLLLIHNCGCNWTSKSRRSHPNNSNIHFPNPC